MKESNSIKSLRLQLKKTTTKQAATIITTTGIRAPNNKRARNKPEWKQSCFKYVWNLPANGRERWCAATLSVSHTWSEWQSWQKTKQKEKHSNRKAREATISLHNRVSVHFIPFYFCFDIAYHNNDVLLRCSKFSRVGVSVSLSLSGRCECCCSPFYFLLVLVRCVALTSTCCVQVVQSATVQM